MKKSLVKVAAVATLAVTGSAALNAGTPTNDVGAFSIKKVKLNENFLGTFDSALTSRSDSENQNLLAYFNSQEVKFSEGNSIYEISPDWTRSHDAGPPSVY